MGLEVAEVAAHRIASRSMRGDQRIGRIGTPFHPSSHSPCTLTLSRSLTPPLHYVLRRCIIVRSPAPSAHSGTGRTAPPRLSPAHSAHTLNQPTYRTYSATHLQPITHTQTALFSSFVRTAPPRLSPAHSAHTLNQPAYRTYSATHLQPITHAQTALFSSFVLNLPLPLGHISWLQSESCRESHRHQAQDNGTRTQVLREGLVQLLALRLSPGLGLGPGVGALSPEGIRLSPEVGG